MKQTAVEWLHNQLHLNISLYQDEWQIIEGLMEQAKEMEKEQIIQAYETAMETDIYNEPLKIGKDYYEQTFKSE